MSNAIAPPPSPDDARAVETETPLAAPIALWRAMRWFLCTLHMLFGAPEDVAFQDSLTSTAHGQLASWLRCAEAMLRRLLLIEAGAQPKPNTRPLLRTARQRVRKLRHFSHDKPEEWRVSFRVLVGDTHARRARGKDGRGPLGACVSPTRRRISREDRWCAENFKPVAFRSAWPLAERYEAILRVFNDPAPYARRLARHLHAKPHRHAEALRAPPEAKHRIDRFDELTELAAAPWRERRSSA